MGESLTCVEASRDDLASERETDGETERWWAVWWSEREADSRAEQTTAAASMALTCSAPE